MNLWVKASANAHPRTIKPLNSFYYRREAARCQWGRKNFLPSFGRAEKFDAVNLRAHADAQRNAAGADALAHHHAARAEVRLAADEQRGKIARAEALKAHGVGREAEEIELTAVGVAAEDEVCPGSCCGGQFPGFVVQPEGVDLVGAARQKVGRGEAAALAEQVLFS